MKKFTLKEIFDIAVKYNQYLDNSDIFFINSVIQDISIDSRKIKINSLFIAIKGPNFNGSDFIEDSFNKFASCCVTDDEVIFKKLKESKLYKNIMLVKSSQEFLTSIAIYNRNRFAGKVISITGSYGKTTLKELLSKILSKFVKISYTIGNLNNNIGLPLTIANMDIKSDVLVLELGTNSVGEISFLSKICKPDISIITAISNAHIGNFQSLEDLAIEKVSIMDGMKKDSLIISDSQTNYYDLIVEKASKKGITLIDINDILHSKFKPEKITFVRDFYTQIGFKNIEDNYTFDVFVNGYGKHNVKLSAYVLYICNLLSLNLNLVAKEIKKCSEIHNGRGNLLKFRINKVKIKIINDTYNASIDTMKSGIDSALKFAEINRIEKTFFILGDIKELGDLTEKIHLELGQFIKTRDVSNLILIGQSMSTIPSDACKSVFYFKNVDDFLQSIVFENYFDSLIYVKGSNSVKLSKIVEYFQNTHKSFIDNLESRSKVLNKKLRDNIKRRIKKSWLIY